MGDTYEPIGGMTAGSDLPPPPPPRPPPPAPKAGDKYVPPPPPPASVEAKESQVPVTSAVGDPDDDFVVSSRTIHGGMSQMESAKRKGPKPGKSTANKVCMVITCLVFLIALGGSIYVSLKLFKVIN